MQMKYNKQLLSNKQELLFREWQDKTYQIGKLINCIQNDYIRLYEDKRLSLEEISNMKEEFSYLFQKREDELHNIYANTLEFMDEALMYILNSGEKK